MSKKGTIKALGLFVVVLTLAFGSVTWFTSVTLSNDYVRVQKQVDEDEWTLLRNSLNLYLHQAKKQGQAEVDYIDLVLNKHYTTEEIEILLDTYGSPDNPVRTLVANTGGNLYFNDIESDSTDGFVVKNFTVATDNSTNCASFGSSRTFELEMLMHGNPALALEAFTRIAIGDVENYNTGAIDKPIFFQFVSHPLGVDMQQGLVGVPLEHQNKLGLELTSYDLDGLKDYFMRTQSWEDTFRAFEFVTPSYIFNKKDLALRPYVEEGFKTNAVRLSLNVVFNYKTVIDHNPVLKRDLYKFEQRRMNNYDTFIVRERMLYLAVALLVIICFMAMNYTNKLMEEEKHT